MKIFKSKKDTKLVFFFDYLTGKNSYKIYSKNSKSTIFDLSADVVLSIVGNDYYEFGVALKEFDLETISVIVLMPSEYNKKSDKTKLKYIDDLRVDLYSHLIEYNKDEVIFVSFGKYSLYALTKTKDIIRQAGKERNTVIDLSTLIEEDLLKGIKKKDLIFKYRTIPNYNPSYLFYNKAVVNNFYFIFNYIRKIINNEKIEEKETKVFTSEEEAINFLNDLLSKKDRIKYIYFDIETESVDLSEVLGVSIDYDDNDIPVYIPIFSNVVKDKISEVLKTFEIVGHNLKFDIQQLIYNGFIKNGEYKIKDDTYILGHLIYNKTLGGLSLKHLAKTLIGVNEDWDNAIKDYMRKHNLKSFKDLPENVLGIYASLDAYYTKKLYHRLIKEYKKEYDYLNNQYKEIIDLVMNWELKGVKINREKLEKIENILVPKMKEAVETIKSLKSVKLYEQEKKRELNINSNQQLTELIDNYLHLSEAKKRTKTGLIKLGREELEELENIYKNLHELSPDNEKIKEKYLFVKSLLEYKLYEKFIKSYINPIKQKIDDFCIFRVDYNIGGTISGRLSSMFHTIPSRGELGKNFKMLIEARNKDYLLIILDISQLEPRIMASLSNDKHLIEAYNTGKDLYKYMASKVFSIPYDEVSKDKRNQMKTLVLAILYGMSANSLAKKLDISKSEAEEIMINFFNEFPDIARWRDEQFIKVKQQRKVITPLKREISVVNESDDDIRKISVNYQIQSTASEVALISFKEVEKLLRKFGFKSFTIGSVHDSLIIETHISEFVDVIKLIKTYMEEQVYNQFDFLRVKLKIDVSVGVSWGNSLELIDIKDNNIILSGKNIDFFLLKNKLENFFSVKSSIKNVEDVDISDLSLYKEYDKILKDIVVDLYLEKNNIN